MSTAAALPCRAFAFPIIMSGLLVLLLALMVLSLLTGTVALTPNQVWLALADPGGHTRPGHIIMQLRLPRVLLACLIGAQFAASGLILQWVLRNPLADPGLIGTSAGASLAIVLLLLVMDQINATRMMQYLGEVSLAAIPLAAMAGGIMATLLVLLLSSTSRMRPIHLVLTGVAVAATLNAIVIWLVVVRGGDRTEMTLVWLAGSLYGRDMGQLRMLLPWGLACLVLVVLVLKPLALMRNDDFIASALGLRVSQWRLVLILLAAVLASAATAVSGPIGFVGLVTPHLARLLVGAAPARLVPVSLVLGAILLVSADWLGRMLISPAELPAGAISTLIGIPVFILLLVRRQSA